MKRLDAVCSLIMPAETIADVGCDHGKVAEYCARYGLAKRIIASDISPDCLNKARNRLARFDNAELVLCDGIKYSCDEAVISGIGGMLVVKIIEEADELPNALILCPHRNVDRVRAALIEHGYVIERDFMCKERDKYYSVMRAVLGGSAVQTLDELQLLFGVHYVDDGEIVSEYLEKLYNTYMCAPNENSKILDRIRAAKNNIENR